MNRLLLWLWLVFAAVPMFGQGALPASRVYSAYMGVYDPTIQYSKNDMVTYGLATYVSLTANNYNNRPDTATNAWLLMGGPGGKASGTLGAIQVSKGDGTFSDSGCTAGTSGITCNTATFNNSLTTSLLNAANAVINGKNPCLQDGTNCPPNNGSGSGPTNYIGMFNGASVGGGQSSLGGIPTTSDSTTANVKIANRWTAKSLAGANEADTYPDPSDNRIVAWHGIMTALAATQGGLVDVPPDYQALNGTPWYRLDGNSLWNDGTLLVDRRYGIETKTFFNPTNIATNNELHAAGGKTCVWNRLITHVNGDDPTSQAATSCDGLGMTSAIGGWNVGGGNIYVGSLETLDFENYSQGISNTFTAYCNHYGKGDNNCIQPVISTLFGSTDGSAEGVKVYRDQVMQANIYRGTVGTVTTNTYGQSVLSVTNIGNNTIGAGQNVINTTPAKMYTANWMYNSSTNGPNSFAIMDLSNIQLGGVAVTSVPVSVCSTVAVGGGPGGIVPDDGTQSTALVLNNPTTGAFNTTDVMFLENDDVPEQVKPTAVTVGSTTTTVQVQLRGYHPAGEFLCQGALAAYAANMVNYSGVGSHYVQYITGSVSPTQVRVGYYRAGVANAFTQADSVQFFPASTVVAPMNPNTGAVDGGSFTIQQAGNNFAPGDTLEIPASISGIFTDHTLTAGITDPYVMSQYDNAVFPAASLVSVPMFQYYLANQIPSPGIPGIGSEGGLLAPPENFIQVNGVVNQGFHFTHPPETSLFQVDAPDATSTLKQFDLFRVDGTGLTYTFATNSFYLGKGGQNITLNVSGDITGNKITGATLQAIGNLTASTAGISNISTGSITVNGKLPCLQDGTNCPAGSGGGSASVGASGALDTSNGSGGFIDSGCSGGGSGNITCGTTSLEAVDNGYTRYSGTGSGVWAIGNDSSSSNTPSLVLNGTAAVPGLSGSIWFQTFSSFYNQPGMVVGGNTAGGFIDFGGFRAIRGQNTADLAMQTNGSTSATPTTRIAITGGADTARVSIQNSILNLPLFTPATPTSACSSGDFSFDANAAWFCTATNTWKSVAYGGGVSIAGTPTTGDIMTYTGPGTIGTAGYLDIQNTLARDPRIVQNFMKCGTNTPITPGTGQVTLEPAGCSSGGAIGVAVRDSANNVSTIPTINTNSIMNLPIHTPASSSESCIVGDIAHDAQFFYSCVATNTWMRVALSTF